MLSEELMAVLEGIQSKIDVDVTVSTSSMLAGTHNCTGCCNGCHGDYGDCYPTVGVNF